MARIHCGAVRLRHLGQSRTGRLVAKVCVKSGSGDGVYLELLQADEKRWRDWDESLRVNPAHLVNPYLEKTLRREYEEALKSERAALPYRQYRLNLPAGEATDTQPLVTGAEWERVCARPVPEREGRPVVGIDLGGSRSWSAAAAVWPSGRIESWAIAPGVPTLAEQEREDQIAEGGYSDLARSGGLSVDEGRAVPGVETLLSRVWSWSPSAIVSDPYRASELNQVVAGRVRVVERARGGGEATSNIMGVEDAPA